MRQRKRYRAGIDIGGTFVDVALQDIADGSIGVGKRLSDPDNPAGTAVDALAEILAHNSCSEADLQQIVHATTIGANTVIQRNGARTALLTTGGFGDILLMQRQSRHSPYDVQFRRNIPLVPREQVFEVPERVWSDGSIVRQLDDAVVVELANRIRKLDVSAIAVTYLHSYLNPKNEVRTREILASELPGVPVSLSSEVAPLLREYERASTTVANAYLQSAFTEYLDKMEATLRERGFDGGFYIMQANGGLATLDQVRKRPVAAVESGPVAGVLMAREHCTRSGLSNVLSFDMGGTTAKAAAVVDGETSTIPIFEIDRTLMRPNTGLPLMVPSVDLVEIGAGGGSIASSRMGIIEVGPQSAGAKPGPACYGIGGKAATVTDASLVLGYLDPDYFNGGAMQLDGENAVAALTNDVGEKLALSAADAAWGVYDAVTENMAGAMRSVTLERGYDPRLFTLVAFGGSGPLHASRVARTLGVPRVLVPEAAGVMSAVGLLVADPKFDVAKVVIGRVDEGVLESVSRASVELRRELDGLLDVSELPGERMYSATVSMRYVGQGHEIEVPIPLDIWDSFDLLEAFQRRFEELFGSRDEGTMAEVVNVELSGRIESTKPPIHVPSRASEATPKRVDRRMATFGDTRQMCAVFGRQDLNVGDEIKGPAIVQEAQCTTVVLEGDRLEVDPRGNLVIEVGRETHE